jgi:hypothetical protein
MTLPHGSRVLVLLFLSLGIGFAVSTYGDSYPMRTLEGEVLNVGHHLGEGDLDLMQMDLGIGGDHDSLQILLAPHEVCEQIGFEIEPGDRVRVRVFLEDTGPARAQKIQNLTRGTMVRLRTLHQTPLWSSAGSWQGGPIRTTMGRHRHGQSRSGGPS